MRSSLYGMATEFEKLDQRHDTATVARTDSNRRWLTTEPTNFDVKRAGNIAAYREAEEEDSAAAVQSMNAY